jgi:hypothetical protein
VEVEMEVDDNITEDDHDDLFASIIDTVESNVQAMDMADGQVHLYTDYAFTTGGGIAEVDVDLFSSELFDDGLRS